MLSYERHEEILNALNSSETSQSDKTDLLGELRKGFGEGTDIISELTSKTEKLTVENSDLVHANSKLFRQIGVTEKDPAQEQKEEEQSFSETITLESIEKGL